MAQSSCFMWIIHGFRYLLLFNGVGLLVVSHAVGRQLPKELFIVAWVEIAIGFP
jgi:hypothetical protein